MYFDDCFYTEMFESCDKTETEKTEHGYYKLSSGEWLCLSKTFKKVKRDSYDDWEVTKSESSVSKDKPGEPEKEDYLSRLLEVAGSIKSKKGSY